jgi:hypothetical protein
MLPCRFDALGMAFMQRILEYHRFAEECRKLAESLVNQRHKQKHQKMAAAWDMLAVERCLTGKILHIHSCALAERI